jgi:hypothetical protein
VVSAARGDPLPGITVGLFESYQPPPVKTDAKGHFRFDGIKVRAIGVTIWAESGYTGRQLIISLENKRDVTGIELKAHKPGVVSGRVEDARGRPSPRSAPAQATPQRAQKEFGDGVVPLTNYNATREAAFKYGEHPISV